MELVVLIIVGVVIVALGIAVAPVILPLLGWALVAAIVLGIVGGAFFLLDEGIQRLGRAPGIWHVRQAVNAWTQRPKHALWRTIRSVLAYLMFWAAVFLAVAVLLILLELS